MREIELTQGYKTIVSDEDYEELSKHNWYLAFSRAGVPRAKRGSNIYMARVLMNAPDHLQVDHINRKPLDNRRENLRLCTSSQNGHNRRKQRKGASSIYKGVSFHRRERKYYSRIGYTAFGQWTRATLGTFTTEREAAETYDKAARLIFGEFAALNFPKEGERSCL
jgi:hypothetical protein